MKYLITSALPYINGIKHLGNLVGSMLPADVYCRFLKQRGHQAIYICGTDEHGTPAEIAALEQGLSVRDFCDDMHTVQLDIYKRFHLDFTFFGRSSAEYNHRMTQEIFKKLYGHGLIDEQIVPSYFSPTDNIYLPDRYIEGICPKCQYQSARGDQCDGCGSLLDPQDLLEPRSALSGDRNLELRQEKHLFLNLEKLQPQIEAWLSQKTEWSRLVLGIAESWLKEGLKARCITRNLNWGVKVPLNGYEDKVFYVWFDAPLGYISMTQEWARLSGHDWESWWKDGSDTALVQFMAKDNVPFHAVFWPAMMIGTGENWLLPTTLKSFSWLTYENGKFSTSQGRGVFTDKALELFEADYWRFALMAMPPEASDADFTFQEFADLVNKDLADKLGNFINRVFTFASQKLDGHFEKEHLVVDEKIIPKLKDLIDSFDSNMSQLKFCQAVMALRGTWSLGNEYFTVKEPWKAIKVDEEETKKIIGTCIYLAGVFAILSFPFIPFSARKIWLALGFTSSLENIDIDRFDRIWGDLHNIELKTAPEILFRKIMPEEIKDLTERYQGV